MSRNARLLNTTSFRLAALCAALFAAILGVLLVFNYFTTSHALEEQMRARIRADFNALAEEADSEGTDAIIKEIEERIAKPLAPGSYFYVADKVGTKLAGNVGTMSLQAGWQILPGTAFGHPAQDTAHEIWGEGKIFEGGFFIFTGQDAYRVLTAQQNLIMSYLWSGILAGVMALIAGAVLSRGFLNRIDAINQTSRAIMQGNLKKRIPERGTSDEIDRLSGNLNRLFDANQALLESLRHVTTNIAHDLRTPLSRLRNRLESAKDNAVTVKSLKIEIGAAIAESDQLLATFAALLRIAQIESGSRKKTFAVVQLSELAERVFGIYFAVAEDEGKVLVAEIDQHVACVGDEELLFQAVVNLVENAIRHTPPGTRITLRVKKPAMIQVVDDGPGVPAAQAEKVLEPFFRLDHSRSSIGNGLGLALVAAIATLHATKVELSDNAPGLRATLVLQPA